MARSLEESCHFGLSQVYPSGLPRTFPERRAWCARILTMSQAAQAITRPPSEVVRETPVSQAPNGVCYAVSGDMNISSTDLERMVSAVPKSIAGALQRKA